VQGQTPPRSRHVLPVGLVDPVIDTSGDFLSDFPAQAVTRPGSRDSATDRMVCRGSEVNMDTIIWHNPRCSKSRQTLALLEARGIKPKVVKYLDAPPSRAELEFVLEKLGMEPGELMRRREKIYKELNLKEIDDSEILLNAMLQHPKLIERPVVIRGEKVAVGRPPESVLDILD
jgi:arsenate reductase